MLDAKTILEAVRICDDPSQYPASAKKGFECNKSRIISVKVEEDGEYDCRKFGLAYTTVGSDTPGVNDFFEHTDLSDKAVQPGTDPDISSQAAAGSSLPASDTEKTVSDADSASLPVSSEETMQNDPPSPDAPSGGKNHTAEILLSTLGLV